MGLKSLLVLLAFGLRPPASSVDYVAHDTVPGLSIGAQTVKSDDLKRRFNEDISRKGFVIVEVGIYPDSAMEVYADDFRLESARPLTPQMVDAKLHPKRPDLPVGGSATIGYESARDNVNGARRQGGFYGGASVATGVGVGPTAPRQRDTRTLDRLEDLELPQGRTAQPVAGYLYFPKPAKKGPYQLTYLGATEQIKLTLP